ncbi:MAG: GGDEF domain-containing protein, partial [Clostridiales bacterium]|nr:GGDEF domain-containing protein [Clostridiales bacterium]
MNHISLDEIRDKLDFFCKMYDVARLVDPLGKRVLECQESSVCATQQVCHDYWENGKICDNCISIRAHQENSSFVKLEKNPETVFLVTAIPIENTGTPAVLELLKNATETMLVGSGDYNQGQLFHRFVGEMNELIVRDTLTSLYNRRFVDERLPADIVDAILQGLPLSVCFLDLDNFKSVNDVCGHKAGDMAIEAVGNVIAGQIRADRDWAARYGGDEFLLCLNNTGEAQARVIAGRIQEGIEAIHVESSSGSIALSTSYGIQTMRDVPMTAEELI